MTHLLKTKPEYFAAQEIGIKPFEVRMDDRGFRVGDILVLQEFIQPGTYSGRELRREVTYILDDPFYCKSGFVVLGTKEARAWSDTPISRTTNGESVSVIPSIAARG